MNEKHIAFGGNLKFTERGTVEGYLVRFTSPESPDLHGEYFDATTDFFLSDYPVVGYNMLYNHGLDESAGVKRVGTFTKVEQREEGLWLSLIHI